MSQLNMKILLAPVLAIALALLLAGAINSLTIPTANDVNLQGKTLGSTPEPTYTYKGHPTPAPQAASISPTTSPFLFIVGAVIVGILAVLLFFREKNLEKDLAE